MGSHGVPVLLVEVADRSRSILSSPEHKEALSGFEIDEGEQVMRKCPPSRNLG